MTRSSLLGYVLQVDCPDLAMSRHIQFKDLKPPPEFRKTIELLSYRRAQSRALARRAAGGVRLHLCWGNYEGPHHYDVPLRHSSIVYGARPQAISFEAANPRHEHEWTLFERAAICRRARCSFPGVIDSTTNFIEHPELVAARIEPLRPPGGRENVIAGTDCGFGTFAECRAPWTPKIAGPSSRVLAEGAALASRRAVVTIGRGARWRRCELGSPRARLVRRARRVPAHPVGQRRPRARRRTCSAAGEWVCDFIRDAGGEAELIDWHGQPLAVGELRASRDADHAPDRPLLRPLRRAAARPAGAVGVGAVRARDPRRVPLRPRRRRRQGPAVPAAGRRARAGRARASCRSTCASPATARRRPAGTRSSTSSTPTSAAPTRRSSSTAA